MTHSTSPVIEDLNFFPFGSHSKKHGTESDVVTVSCRMDRLRHTTLCAYLSPGEARAAFCVVMLNAFRHKVT